MDTNKQERARGITIFSKQAVVELEKARITLLDTPGHVDFSAEILNYDKTNEKSKDNLINSIVNTLTELTEINKVKFLVDGTENAEFSGTYTRKAT